MYERLSHRARKVLQFANQAARRSHDEYIGTEHLLLGIIQEGTGAAVAILNTFQVDLQAMTQQVESRIGSRPEKPTSGEMSETPRAKQVIEYAMDEARDLAPDSKSIGTDLLLLGLLREREGIAGQVLLNFGLRCDEVRREITERIGFGAAE
jgi:ATP-dependent Clp protease ATP-binding subunit ClpC